MYKKSSSKNWNWKRLLTRVLFVVLIVSAANSSAILAQMTSERLQLLEEKQIARMILEIENSREEIAALTKENTAKDALIAKLDARIQKLTELADQHKAAADDREKALDLQDQAAKLYRESLKDANKQIERLKKSNRFWKKVSGGAMIAGFLVGFLLSHQ